jgi:hypothetical protein
VLPKYNLNLPKSDLTYNFKVRTTETLGETFSIVPYVGTGIGIKTGDDASVGFLLSGGLDVPLDTARGKTDRVTPALARSWHS